jgi:hypothetical protein
MTLHRKFEDLLLKEKWGTKSPQLKYLNEQMSLLKTNQPEDDKQHLPNNFICRGLFV